MNTSKPPTYNYEVLSYYALVELKDPEGRQAVYLRRERIRFLEDRVSTIDDYGWGNGIAFAAHEVYPGAFIQREITGSRLRGTVRLPHHYQKADELAFSVERLIKNGFVSPSECWLEAELYHAVHYVSLKVILPRTRRVRAARLIRPGTPGSRALRISHRPDGRQWISYHDRNPAQGQRYTVLWEW